MNGADDAAGSVVREMGLAVLESAGEAIVVTDLEGSIRYVNPSFERITGYAREEVLGRTPRILKSDTQDASFYESLWQTITGGKIWRGSFLNRCKDGSLYHVEQTIAPVTNNVGQPIGYVSVHADVSRRKRLEARLRDAEIHEARQQAEHELHLAEREIEIARSVQQHLFPRAAPRVPGFEFAGAVYPADKASGDYFDFIPMRQDGVGVVVADVSGHGLGPAMMMVQTRAYLRALARSEDDLGGILTHTNQLLFPTYHGRFVSLFFGRIDPRSRSFSFASAGHRGYLLKGDGSATTLDGPATVLGVLEDESIPCSPAIALEAGDLILLPTDGIQEARTSDVELFGVSRTLDVVRATRDKSAKEIVHALYQAARDWAQGGPQDDDITAVVIKVQNR